MRLALAVACACLSVVLSPASALADGCQDYNLLTGVAVQCQVEEESSDEPGAQGDPGVVRTSSGQMVPPELVGQSLSVGADASGNPCFNRDLAAFGNVTSAEAANRAAVVMIETLGYGTCPAVPGQPPVVLPSPEQVALAFWRQADLPVPQPYVAPGFATTGKWAYLESGAQAAASFRFDTVLGPLTIDAQSAGIWVDWGDGEGWEGPYQSLGGPWPDGEITNLYGDRGDVTITVTQEWTATWAVAGANGTLGGMMTTGTIPDFHVGEIRAVLGDGDGDD